MVRPRAGIVIAGSARLARLTLTRQSRLRAVAMRRLTGLAQVEQSLERQRKLFTWGHISEADYRREAARLEELRERLKGDLPAKRSTHIRGIRELWENGDADARRQLLGTLFDRLILRDGETAEYVPRPDRAAEAIALVEQAIGPTE